MRSLGDVFRAAEAITLVSEIVFEALREEIVVPIEGGVWLLACGSVQCKLWYRIYSSFLHTCLRHLAIISRKLLFGALLMRRGNHG